MSFFYHKRKKTQILILHMKKIMNLIIETFENRIKPKPQFIIEKISKFFSFKKRKMKKKRVK